MNREIKFRAWDSYNKFMINPVCELHDNGHFWGEDFTNTDYVVTGKSHIMQFTGLTDKNGKEIYEGDIFPSMSDGIKFYKVVFENSAFVVYHNHGYCGTLGKLIEIAPKFNFNLEIIGNIYENPELLDGSVVA